jgi:transketolase
MRESTVLKVQERAVSELHDSCALQYILLHLLGYKLSIDDLKAFRQLDSLTPGHPEAGHTDGTAYNNLLCSPTENVTR